MHVRQLDCVLFHVLPRVFGCTYFVQNCSPFRAKLVDKAICCVFLGYSPQSKGYRCYDLVARHFYTFMDVTFQEDVPFFAGPNHSFVLVPQETTLIHD